MSVAFADPITQPQRKFLDSLVKDRAVSDAQVRAYALVSTKKEASQLIGEFKALPFKTAKVETKPGYYVRGEDVFQVVLSKAGRPYAKQMVLQGTKGRWEYAPGIAKEFETLKPLSAEEAGVLGKKFGVCMICGRTLTHPDSVAAGIGPICRGNL